MLLKKIFSLFYIIQSQKFLLFKIKLTLKKQLEKTMTKQELADLLAFLKK